MKTVLKKTLEPRRDGINEALRTSHGEEPNDSRRTHNTVRTAKLKTYCGGGGVCIQNINADTSLKIPLAFRSCRRCEGRVEMILKKIHDKQQMSRPRTVSS